MSISIAIPPNPSVWTAETATLFVLPLLSLPRKCVEIWVKGKIKESGKHSAEVIVFYNYSGGQTNKTFHFDVYDEYDDFDRAEHVKYWREAAALITTGQLSN